MSDERERQLTDLRKQLAEAQAIIATLKTKNAAAAEREGTVRLSEERYRTIVETSLEGIWMIDADGRTSFVNARMAQMLGYAPGEMLGRPARDFVDEEERARTRHLMENRRQGIAEIHMSRLMRKDGSFFWAQMSTAPILGPKGEFLGALAMATDVTEQHMAQQAVAQSETTFRSLIEELPDLVIVHRGGKVSYVNPTAVRALGLRSPMDVVDKPLAELIGVSTPVAPALLSEHELRFRRHDGSEFLAEVRSMSVSFLGSPAELIVARDATVRRQLEERLLVSDRMASIGTLAAGVAHEINNPLAYVMANVGYAVSTLESIGDPQLAEVIEALQEAAEGADRVKTIVRDLKTFSRGSDTLTPVDLHRVVETTSNMAWNEIRHRARLVKDLGPDVPPVLGNESRLSQVLLNLLVNAAQAIREGEVHKNEIRISTRLAAGRVIVEVRDTGTGMTPEVRARLFSPFFTTKPVGVGTGLGLSICLNVVTQMGGTIEVDSEPGKGSAFRVILPAARAVQTTAAPERVVKTPTRRGRVLLIDDEEATARALHRVLRETHDLFTETRAAAALDRLRGGEHFDVVLCDLMMPEMTGMDFHAALKQFAPALADQVVFITGGAFTPSAEGFTTEVPNRFIEKPFDLKLLLALIEEKLG